MSVALTFDPVLSRIRLTATALGAADVATVERSTDQLQWSTVRGGAQAVPALTRIVSDTFSSASVDSWNPADTGQSWTTTGGAAGDYDKAAGVGTMALPDTAASRNALIGSAALADVEVRTTFTVPATATGDSYNGFALARRVDGNNHYALRAAADTTGNIDVEIQRRLAGVTSVIATASNVFAYAAGNVIGLAFRVVGSTLQGKVWNVTTGSEPVGWTVTAVDASIAAGQVGVRADRNGANTNAGLVLSFDNFTADEYQLNLDDYEFVPNVVNYYRVRGVETGAITYVGAGAAATAVNASVAPALPTGLAVGDAMVALASIRNSGAGTVNLPAQWSLIRAFGNVSLIGKKYAAGDTAPTITFAGGVANADTIGQVAAWRRADIAPVTGNDQLNGSAQNIAHPAVTVPQNGCVTIAAGWKQDDFTSVATLTSAPGGWAEIGEGSSTAGDDASQVWDYLIQTTATNVTANSFTVTGGAAAISRALLTVLPHAAYLNEQTANVTPSQSAVWLKSVPRPFLNRAVSLLGSRFSFERVERVGTFPIVGRSLPVAVTDVRGSRQYQLVVRTDTEQDGVNLDLLLASGDILFLQAPTGAVVPSGGVFVFAGRTVAENPIPPDPMRFTLIPVTEVAAPGPDVVGSTGSWQTVLDTYPTWAAVLAVNLSWGSLLELVGAPTEVVIS